MREKEDGEKGEEREEEEKEEGGDVSELYSRKGCVTIRYCPHEQNINILRNSSANTWSINKLITQRCTSCTNSS